MGAKWGQFIIKREIYMLVITRRIGESVLIGDFLEIFITNIDRNIVKIAFDCDRSLHILRSEVKNFRKDEKYMTNLEQAREKFLTAANECTPYVTYNWEIAENRGKCHYTYRCAVEYFDLALFDESEKFRDEFRFAQWWVNAYAYRIGKWIYGEMK